MRLVVRLLMRLVVRLLMRLLVRMRSGTAWNAGSHQPSL